MGFKIWSVGYTGGSSKGQHFRYAKDDCLDKDDFEPPMLLSMIPDSPDAAGVAKKIVGTPDSHLGDATKKGIFKVAELIFAHQVVTGVNLLALHGGGGSISVYCHEKKWYWADANSFVNYRISRESNPGKEFLRSVAPGLKKTSLNNFGVLAEISMCLSAYDAALPQSEEPHLRIELRH